MLVLACMNCLLWVETFLVLDIRYFRWNLNTRGIMLWDSGSYLNILLQQASSDIALVGEKNTVSLLPSRVRGSAGSSLGFCWPQVRGKGRRKLLVKLGEGGRSGFSLILLWLGGVHCYCFPHYLHWYTMAAGLPCYIWGDVDFHLVFANQGDFFCVFRWSGGVSYCLKVFCLIKLSISWSLARLDRLFLGFLSVPNISGLPASPQSF